MLFADPKDKFSLVTAQVAQSVTCLATDACLTADPGVASSIPAQHHTFVEIDHEIISTLILLLPLIYSRRVVAGPDPEGGTGARAPPPPSSPARYLSTV